MKKLISIVLVAAMALSMVACGGASSSAPASTGASSEAASTAASGEATSGKEITVGMITDVGGVNDRSFNQTSWEGLQTLAEENPNIKVSYLESKTDADYSANIETYLSEGTDLIICVGYMLAEATKVAAEANPDQLFAIIDDSSIDLPNVACLMFSQAEASYLVGIVAGLATETNTVGYVQGMVSDSMNQFGCGFIAGVKSVNPEATVLQFNANNFGDPTGGNTAATDMITKGADVVFHAAGATGNGVIEACKANGVYAIGVDRDQYNDAPGTVVTSAMKRVDNAVYDSVESLINGTLKGGVHTYDLAAGGVDIAPSQDLLPEDVKKAVEDVKKKIVAGEVTVPSSKEEFEAAYGDVYQLD